MSASQFRLARFRKVALLVLSVASWNAGALLAQECPAVDEFGRPRECTITEIGGQCGWNAWQSWQQCRRGGKGSWWYHMACDFYAAVDLIGCTRPILEGLIPL